MKTAIQRTSIFRIVFQSIADYFTKKRRQIMIFRMNKNLAWATMDRVNGYEKTLNGDLKNVYEKIMNEARSYDIPFVGYDKFIDMVAKSPKIVLQQGRNKMTIYIRWKRS